MSGSKRQLVTIPLFACLLLIEVRTVRAFGVESPQGDPKGKMQVSTLPLDTMNGLEVLGVSEKGAVPVKVQSGVGNYHGRRARWSYADRTPRTAIHDPALGMQRR